MRPKCSPSRRKSLRERLAAEISISSWNLSSLKFVLNNIIKKFRKFYILIRHSKLSDFWATNFIALSNTHFHNSCIWVIQHKGSVLNIRNYKNENLKQKFQLVSIKCYVISLYVSPYFLQICFYIITEVT